jgi:UDP-N-acetylmuramoyl-L-alanyl-D-glutamate--2,6-diaminopimelate ligase
MQVLTDYTKVCQLLKQKGVRHLFSHSDHVEENSAFFALRGKNHNGNQYINSLLVKGALVAITDDPEYETSDLIIKVQDARECMHVCGLNYYDLIPNNIALVTGTNGKTSVVHYFQQILNLLGCKSASIGTLGCISNLSNAKFHKCSLTTPDFLALRRILYDLALAEICHVAVEASSIALTQDRFFGIKTKLSAFTSFGIDHLDYHQNKESYLQAKLRLFTEYCVQGGVIVAPTTVADLISKNIESDHRIISLGSNGTLKYQAEMSSVSGQSLVFSYFGKTYRFQTSIIGAYQAENLLTATILCHHCGIDLSLIVDVLEKVVAAPGRLEKIADNIFIDYAHNEEGLNSLLLEMHKIKAPNQKIWLVFGCGGERDSSKRSAMGKIANFLADVVVVTDDNPRNEDPAQIRKAILLNCPKALEIPERNEAIMYAVKNLPSDAILLIAGKGHERYQIIKNKTVPFCEKEIIQLAINQKSKSQN